jgi:hypothetical protein
MSGERRDPSMPIFPPSTSSELRERVTQAIASYLLRGRRFAELDEKALNDAYVLAVREWCRHRDKVEVARDLNELNAEHMLRRRPVPFARVERDLQVLLSGTAARAAGVFSPKIRRPCGMSR